MMGTLKKMVLMGCATLLVACGTAATPANTKTNANMDKNFNAILKQERSIDEVAYTYHIANIQKEYDDLITLHNQFSGKRLNEVQMDQIERQAEELGRAIDSFSALAPGSEIHRKSEESLFNVMTLMKKLAKEAIAVANTNGIDTLGGLDGTVEDLQRPMKVLDTKWMDELEKSKLPDNVQLIDIFFQESDLPMPVEAEGKPGNDLEEVPEETSLETEKE